MESSNAITGVMKSKEFRHKMNNLISVVSLSTYKIMKIADTTSDEELKEIGKKLTSASEKMKQALLDLKRED